MWLYSNYYFDLFQTAVMEYNNNSTLKHMINKIRRDPQVFDRYGSCFIGRHKLVACA